MHGVTSYGFISDELLAPHVRCAYPSKVCANPRAVKLCGSLHKLCEFHRKKANLNQKRLQQRRRVIRAQMIAEPEQDGSSGPGRQAACGYSYSLDDRIPEPHVQHDGFESDELTQQDVQLLHSILFGEPSDSVFVFPSSYGAVGGSGCVENNSVMTMPAQGFDGPVEMLDNELCL